MIDNLESAEKPLIKEVKSKSSFEAITDNNFKYRRSRNSALELTTAAMSIIQSPISDLISTRTTSR